MREYKNRKNVQKQNYYQDRFYHAPHTKKLEIIGSIFEEDYEKLKQISFVCSAYIELDFFVVEVEKKDILNTIKAMSDLGYNSWTELACIDMIEQKGGFEIVYLLLNMEKRARARVKTFVKQKEQIDSVSSVFKAANWAEREAYDMYGVIFANHPNPKRLLMPDDWYDYPLLKTYPLEGDEKAKWYEIDRIFGKEYREVVGEENRDSGYVNNEDYNNFARIYHESKKGEKPMEVAYLQEYQEEEGVMFVKPVKRKKD